MPVVNSVTGAVQDANQARVLSMNRSCGMAEGLAGSNSHAEPAAEARRARPVLQTRGFCRKQERC